MVSANIGTEYTASNSALMYDQGRNVLYLTYNFIIKKDRNKNEHSLFSVIYM